MWHEGAYVKNYFTQMANGNGPTTKTRAHQCYDLIIKSHNAYFYTLESAYVGAMKLKVNKEYICLYLTRNWVI